MNVLSSHPFYIKREELSNSDFNSFVQILQEKGYVVQSRTTNTVVISQTKDSPYNNIVVCYPEKASDELALCRFYNADNPITKAVYHPHSSLLFFGMAMNLTKFFPVLFYGNSLSNPDRILNEPFCSEILKIFLSTIRIFRCPNCGKFTFSKENWEHEDPRLSEERITHGLNVIANVLFLGGHGAGGEWSQATKQRYKYEGYNLTCSKCGHVHKVTTSILPI